MVCVFFACVFGGRQVTVGAVGGWFVGDVVRFILLIGIDGLSLRVVNTSVICHSNLLSVVFNGAGMRCCG